MFKFNVGERVSWTVRDGIVRTGKSPGQIVKQLQFKSEIMNIVLYLHNCSGKRFQKKMQQKKFETILPLRKKLIELICLGSGTPEFDFRFQKS